MNEKKKFFILLLFVINLISATKTAQLQHESKTTKRSKPITKPGKNNSDAGYLLKTNKGKIYLARGRKGMGKDAGTDPGGLVKGKKTNMARIVKAALHKLGTTSQKKAAILLDFVQINPSPNLDKNVDSS